MATRPELLLRERSAQAVHASFGGLWHPTGVRSIRELKDHAGLILDEYTDGAKHYAFRTYDRAPLNQGDALLPEDVLAANLLSLKLSWQEVVPLFAEGDGAPQRLLAALNAALVPLRAARPFERYQSVEEMQSALAPVARANEATVGVGGWTQVTVSKVLHRHAPHIVPLVDSRVRTFYGGRAGKEAELRARIWQDLRDNLEWLAPLAQQYRTPDGRDLSALRTLDILIWTPVPTEGLTAQT